LRPLIIVLAAPSFSPEDVRAATGLSIQATVSWGYPLDRALVERAQHGDEDAFDTLASQIGDRLYGVAHHILRNADAAADAAQQAMIDIWRKLPRLSDPDRFLAWSYRIVVRAAYAEAARRRRWVLAPTSLPTPTTAAGDHATAAADRDQLERGFRRLSVDHRAVVVLKHFADLADDQIAEILEIPVGTVRSRLHHSIRSLRAALEADARPASDRSAS
jgi:RNA polymerase sigma-70 factor (ECF subfamily)